MSERCPTCGQPLPQKTPVMTADELVTALRWRHGAPRDVYEGADRANTKIGSGRYFITSSGGMEVTRSAIDEALKRGLIQRKYDIDGYWCLSADGVRAADTMGGADG